MTQDEFVLLSQKVNSPTLTAVAGETPLENSAEAEASLAAKGIVEAGSVNATVKQILDILDNAPATRVTRIDAAARPYDVLAVKDGKIGAVHQSTVKDWARHITTYTLGLDDEANYIEALQTYMDFIETADNQQVRKFTSNVTKKNHELYSSTLLNYGPNLAIKRYRRGYGLKTMEMYQFNAFLMPKKENFSFKYEEGGKEILCECLRSGGFQIIQVPSKNFFGQPSIKFYHLGMKKSFEGVKAAISGK
jgi:hypothetical protein